MLKAATCSSATGSARFAPCDLRRRQTHRLKAGRACTGKHALMLPRRASKSRSRACTSKDVLRTR